MSDQSQLGLPPGSKPGLPPPPGVTPDFHSPFTLQPYQSVTVAGCIIFTSSFLLARMVTKYFVMKQITWEDYTCMFGWIVFMVYLGIHQSIGFHGGGTHQWNTTKDDVFYNHRFTNYNDMMYSLSLFFTKLSLMLLILRIFCSAHRHLGFWLTWALIVLNSIFYLLFFLIPIFECQPREKIWDSSVTGKCLDVNVLYLASTVFNVISDIAMLSVPIYMIWNLQMSLQRKMGVSAIFCTGGLACISSILRLVYTIPLTRTDDYTYHKLEGVLWSMAEIAFGILCSCLVVLPRLFQHLTSMKPYTDQMLRPTPRDQKQQPSHTYNVSIAANDHEDNRQWVQLQESNVRTPPLKHLDDTKIDDGGMMEAENRVDGMGDLEEGFGANHTRN